MNDTYKILLVDDSESDRGIYRRYLLTDKNFDYQILEAETLEEALELWRSQSPDLVLTDIHLPDGNGLELLAAIKKTHPSQKFPVIMMTGQGDERLAVQAMKLGASDYLVKGDITAATLCRVVRQGMDKWTLSRQLMQLQQQLESQNSDLIQAVEALKMQKDFNRLIAEISSRFGEVTDETLDFEIDRSLQLIGEMSQVDTAYLFTLDRDRQTLSMSHEWSQPGGLRQLAIAQNVPFAAFPYSIALLLQQQYCCVKDTALLPPEAAVDAASWQQFNIKSVVSIPLIQKGETEGFIGFSSFGQAIAWDEEIIQILTTLSQTIVNTQERIEAENIRKKNEIELAQWRKRYELAEQASGQMIYEYDFLTNSVIWGTNAPLIVGYAKPDLPCRLDDWLALIHPEDLSSFQQALATATTNKTPFFCQYRFRHQAGHYLWLEDCNQWLLDEQGKEIGVIGMITDISDEKDLELLLRKQALVFKNMTDGVIITDMDGLIIDWNRGAENLYGYTKAEILGKSPSRLHTLEDSQWLQAEIFQTTLQNGFWSGEVAVVCKDGTQKITTTSTILLKDNQKNNISIIGLNHDITKLKKIEEELRDNNEKLQQFNQELEMRVEERTHQLQASEAFNRSILETLPDLLLRLYRDGTCLSYIPPKVQPENFEPISLHTSEILPPDLLERQLQTIEQALITGELQVYEHQVFKNNQTAYEEVRILAINEQEVLVIVRDISDRKQTELKLQQSEEINRTILETIPDLLIHRDIQGNYLLKSKGQGVRVIGLEDPSIQLKVEDILPSHLAQQQLYFANLALETGTLQIFEQIVDFPDERRFEEVRIAPLNNNDQQVLIMIRDISDRKIMEKNLEESRDKFQRLVDEMGEKFVVFSHSGEEGDGIVNYVSDGIYSVFGFSKEDVFGKHWAEVVNWLPEELPKAQARLMSMAQGEQDFCQSEMRFIHPDGSIRTLQVSEHPVKNETGKFLAIEGIIEDISDRKIMEKNLEESRDKFQRLVDEMGEKFVVFSHSGVEGIVNYASDGVYPIFGLTKEDVLGKHWADVINWLPEELPRAEQRLIAMVQGKSNFHQPEMQFIHPDGGIRTIQVSEHPVRNEVGEMIAIEGIIEDISDRKLAEEALKASERLFSTLVSTSPVGIFRFDRPLNCIYVNERWCEITGRSAASAMGKGWIDAIHPDERDFFKELIDHDFYSPSPQKLMLTGEARHLRPDGSINWCYFQAVHEFNEIGEVIGYIGTITDISDRKQAEKALNTERLRLKLALDAANMGTWSRSPESDQLIWSDRVQEIFGFVPGTFPGDHQTFISMIHPEDRDRVIQAIAHTFATGEVYHLEYRIVRLDGEMRWITVWGLPSETLSTNERQMIGILADISDRKANEIKLKESQQFLQTVLDSFPLAVFWKNRESVLQGCNQFFAQISELDSPQEAVGRTNFDFSYTEAQAQGYLLDDQQVMTSGISLVGIEETITLPTGETRWIETNKVPLRDLEGHVMGILGTFQDVTERVENRQALLDLTDRLKIALKSGAIGCWEWEIANNIVTWDERMYELYGISVETTVVFETFVNCLYPDDRQATLTLIQEAVAGKAEYDMEFRVIHPDGSIHFLKCHGAVMRDDKGNPLRIIGVNFEITEQKQAEQTIRQQIKKETLLRQITQHIRETLDLQQIFETACQDIRQFVHSDRVGIFQFYRDSGFDDGVFVAESVKEGLSSVLAIPIHDHCFGEDYAQRYTEGHFQAISDVLNSDLQDCHKAVLTQFQIRANLVIPLLFEKELWGLLCIHSCDAPRSWQPDEIDLIQQIAAQLTIAIQQGNLYNQIQAELMTRQQIEEKIRLELRRKQLLGEMIQSIRDSLDMTEILANVTQKIQAVLNCDRVIVFQLFADGRSKIVEESVSEPFPPLKNLYWEDEIWPQEILDYYWQGIPRIVPDVMNDRWTDCLMEYSIEGQIQSKIVAPILQEAANNETHRWVSSEKQDKLWGVLVVYACAEKRVWKDEEAEILQQIANQLAIAIQQANLFKQLQKEQQKLTQTNQALTESNESLARATRLKDEFLANMSHELRTPLTAILGMSEVLQTNTLGKINLGQEKAIKLIEKSGEHLLTLINDILDLSKIEAGKLELKLAPTSVQILCENSTIFVRHMASTQNIELQTHIAKNIDQILVDELRIRQCLINLLSNAIKFTPAGGNVILSVELEEKDILFSVTDTGIGISPTDLDKLFQPFIQIDSSLNRQYAGTGLGLVLVERIITKHGGRVSVISRVGEGSCFAFRLPYSPSSKKIIPENVETTSLSTNETNAPLSVSPLILLADDNETNRQTLDDYLTNKGYRILLAYDGREAVEMAKTHRPNLILMDIQMPEMDGLEATTLIRSDPAIAHIPIIALTALALPEQVERCLAVGINEYLVKPLRFKILMETIQKFC